MIRYMAKCGKIVVFSPYERTIEGLMNKDILCYTTYFQAVLRYALVCFKNYCLFCGLTTLKD